MLRTNDVKTLKYIVQKMKKQRKASVDDNGNCLYFADDGCRCAIGHLMVDNAKDQDVENKSVEHLFSVKKHVIREEFWEFSITVAATAQMAHDNSTCTRYFFTTFSYTLKDRLKTSHKASAKQIEEIFG